MAGSYRHVTNRAGQFTGLALIENLGDAYEAIEEFYGMVWWLAGGDADRVRAAEANYRRGINEFSPGAGQRVEGEDEDGDLHAEVGALREWWHDHNRETFIALADELVGRRVPAEDVPRILGRAAGAIADEYGD